jgi:hypothetical protein
MLDAACKNCYNLSILFEAIACASPDHYIQLDPLPAREVLQYGTIETDGRKAVEESKKCLAKNLS